MRGPLPRGSAFLSPSVLRSTPLPAFLTRPQGLRMGQAAGEAQAGLWDPCCVWTHTQPYTSCSGSSLVALGAVAGLGAWVWSAGRQGCWPQLAWRSHSSPGKAENRRPQCPGVLCNLTPSPSVVLSSSFSLLSFPLLFCSYPFSTGSPPL